MLDGKAIELEDKKDFPELDAEALEKDETIKITPLLGADPGMTTANLKLVTVDVTLPGELVTYETRLDKGEYLNRRVVDIDDLPKLVEGMHLRHTQYMESDNASQIIPPRVSPSTRS